MSDILKVIDYKVVTANGSTNLSNQVMTLIEEEGFELYGNLVVTGTYLNDDVKYKYSQALVKYEE